LNPDEVTSKKPSTNVPGFFVFKAFKTCFDKRLKIKRPKIAQAILGFMLGLNQKLGTRVSVIPLFCWFKRENQEMALNNFFGSWRLSQKAITIISINFTANVVL